MNSCPALKAESAFYKTRLGLAELSLRNLHAHVKPHPNPPAFSSR